jgi:DNA (cytosine-5)-methyltransferase 1
MTQYEAWPDEPINLLVGGTPCQSFSVAGLRKGLADPRGNLMLTYGAIAKRYRPEWLVWENVPGVLSSNGGRDFGTFLGMLAELGYGFAYRVLDAQYFGVAQRRRRVFVVGHLGNWQRAAAVLFERHSLQGHPAPSREKGQNSSTFFESSLAQYRAENVGGTLKASGGVLGGGSETFVANTLTAGIGRRNDVESDTFAVEPMAWDSEMNPSVNVAGTLLRGGQGGRQDGICQLTYGIPGNWIGRQPENGGNAVEPMHDVSPCLTKTDRHGVAAMQVRRLTPVECERLQGFPDGYTNIPWRNKPESPDGPRYKAMGNSMAVPVMRWIGERIAAVEAL